MARNIITGIDAGTSTIKVVIAEKKDEHTLQILGVVQRHSTGIRRGYVINLEEAIDSVKTAVKNAEKMSGVQVKHAYVSIGGISLSSAKSKGTVMVARADGEVAEYDIKRAMDQCEANLPNSANKQIIQEIPLHYKIDNNPVFGRPAGMKGTKLEVETLYITSLNQHLNDLVKAVESAGVAVDDIIASPLAASYSALTKHQKEVGCVLANIGAGTVSIVVFEEDTPISLEVFPIGSTHITNDIALGLQIPLDEAEKIKIEYNTNLPISKRKLNDIIEARLNDIFELIESHLKKINRNGLLPAGIILTGGGSGLFSLEDIAKASLNLPAKVAAPITLNGNGVKIIGNYKDQVLNDPGWSVALGLCMAEMQDHENERVGKGGFGGIKSTLKKLARMFLP
jgi:cell division protein FtsA